MTGLTPKVAYRFTVRARNSAGTGPVSAASISVVVRAPTQPRGLKATSTARGTATVGWPAPAYLNSPKLIAFQVRWSANLGRTWSSWSSTRLARVATKASLRRGSIYVVQVRALNAAGSGVVAALRFVQKT